jgi:alkylation response protein AidB-like acyl-CoA dehydrogenase
MVVGTAEAPLSATSSWHERARVFDAGQGTMSCMAAVTEPAPVGTLHAAVQGFVRDVVDPEVADWDREDLLPQAVLQTLVGLGLTGALVPREYGGQGLTVSELVPVWRTLSQGWISLTGAVNPTCLATTLLVRHGTEEQRRRWLPEIATGKVLCSFSITEPQAGSDLSKLEMAARERPGGGYVLDGRKRWIAGGLSSDVIFMMCRVEGAEKPSCLILPAEGRGGAGWTVEELDKIGYRGVESGAYAFESFESPRAEVLGGEPGRGARHMLDALDVGRINVACRGLGIIDRALSCATHEAVGREIGDGVLADFTHTQLRLGELQVRRMATAALVERAAVSVSARRPDARELATAAKLQASDGAVWAVDVASRLAASRSYRADDELARLRRDAPQTQIGEGANDALLLALAKPIVDRAIPSTP